MQFRGRNVSYAISIAYESAKAQIYNTCLKKCGKDQTEKQQRNSALGNLELYGLLFFDMKFSANCLKTIFFMFWGKTSQY